MSEENAAMMEGAYSANDNDGNELEQMELDDEEQEPRAIQIKRLKTEIDERKKLAKALGKDHRNHITKARLLINAKEHYKDHEMPNRWDYYYCSRDEMRKENLLLALQSNNVPDCMQWDAPRGNPLFFQRASRKIQDDRDVLLARLQLTSFEETFANKIFQPRHKVRLNWTVISLSVG